MNFSKMIKPYSNHLCLIAHAPNKDDYSKVDLSESTLEDKGIKASNIHQLEQYLAEQTKIVNTKVLYGGYLEKRNLYANTQRFNAEEIRNIHLGLDFWAPAKTKIVAPLDGIVQVAHYNKGVGNYGGTIVLKHRIENVEFFSLYGHLNKKSLHINIGKIVHKGETFCELGDPSENGNYLPHLHFQWIVKFPVNATDYPGVCSETQLEYFAKNSPQPQLYL